MQEHVHNQLGVTGRYKYDCLTPYEKEVKKFRTAAYRGDEIYNDITKEFVLGNFPQEDFDDKTVRNNIYLLLISNEFVSKLPIRYKNKYALTELPNTPHWHNIKEGVLGDLYEAWVYYAYKTYGKKRCKRIVQKDILNQLREEYYRKAKNKQQWKNT